MSDLSCSRLGYKEQLELCKLYMLRPLLLNEHNNQVLKLNLGRKDPLYKTLFELPCYNKLALLMYSPKYL